jgi:hypothetical protein
MYRAVIAVKRCAECDSGYVNNVTEPTIKGLKMGLIKFTATRRNLRAEGLFRWRFPKGQIAEVDAREIKGLEESKKRAQEVL